MEKPTSKEEMEILIDTHQILKQQEIQLTKKTGTVIVH
jgi:hypothetical protein